MGSRGLGAEMEVGQEIHAVRDEAIRLEGWVAIDRTVRGESSGGLRMTPTVNEEELRLLARTMTLKYGFLGFPKGGAKAGIRGDPEGDPRRTLALLAGFGRAIRPLLATRRFHPGPDMGTNEEMIRHLLAASGIRQRKGSAWRWADSGRHTGAGLVGALFAAARRLSISRRDLSVSIEGLGAVGLSAARRLTREGVRIAAVANRFGRIRLESAFDPEAWDAFAAAEGPERIERFPGARPITHKEFLALPVHAFLPCALTHTLNGRNSDLLAARCVAPGANNPATPEATRSLEARGVLVLPDFVANAGGVLGGALSWGGIPNARAEAIAEARIGEAVETLLARAEREGLSPNDLAERTALARIERMERASSSRLALLGLSLKRKGFVPRAAGRFAASLYAARLRDRLTDWGTGT